MSEGAPSSTATPSPTAVAAPVAAPTANSAASGRSGCDLTCNSSKKEVGESMGGRKLDASAPAFSPSYAVIQHSSSTASPQVLRIAAALTLDYL